MTDTPSKPRVSVRGDRSASPINERFARGLATMQAIDPDQTVRILSGVGDIAPDFAAYLVEYAFGDIGSRPGLDLKQREFAAVAALAAMGAATPQLKARINGALKVGWTQEELVELLMQISVHAGFPAAINALTALREVLEDNAAAARVRFKP
jgi:4-carboxymuconolactone decarboxylase